MTHTVTHTTKRVDGHSGADRAYLPQYTERKASKSLKKQQAECPDTLRNQQVMCSSHTTSSKKHRKLRFSMLFCCKNAENGASQNVGQLPDPHRDPHAEMHGKGERAPERKLLPFRCSACLWDLSNLRHEAAHFLRGLLLHLPRGVGVSAEGEARVIVTQHRGYCFHIYTVLQCQGRECVPQVVEPDMLQPRVLEDPLSGASASGAAVLPDDLPSDQSKGRF